MLCWAVTLLCTRWTAVNYRQASSDSKGPSGRDSLFAKAEPPSLVALSPLASRCFSSTCSTLQARHPTQLFTALRKLPLADRLFHSL